MNLTKENLQEWKSELNHLAEPHFGKNFANCLSDEDWMAENLGDDTQYVVNENLRADW